MATYKYRKQHRTNIVTDVLKTESDGQVWWISLSDPSNHNYVDWKEWEAAGNTTEAAD